MTTERLLPIADVVKRTRIGRSQIYALIKVGRFPAPRRISHRTSRWRESDVAAWIAALFKEIE